MNKNEMLERQLASLDDMNVADLKARFLELYGFWWRKPSSGKTGWRSN